MFIPLKIHQWIVQSAEFLYRVGPHPVQNRLAGDEENREHVFINLLIIGVNVQVIRFVLHTHTRFIRDSKHEIEMG